MKIVSTWPALRAEVAKLLEFHRRAVHVLESMLEAAEAEDPRVLADVVAEHRGLQAREAFRVSKTLLGEGVLN